MQLLQNHSRVVDDVVQVQQLVSELTTVTGVLRTGGIVLLVLVGFVVLFIIVNTIRLAVVARREEIEIMRLVGASDAFIRWPFIFEGAFVGLLGAAAALAIIALVSGPVSDFMYGFFRVLPIELGSLQTDMTLLVVGTGFGAGRPWIVALRAELPDQVGPAPGLPGRPSRTPGVRCRPGGPGSAAAPVPSTRTRPMTPRGPELDPHDPPTDDVPAEPGAPDVPDVPAKPSARPTSLSCRPMRPRRRRCPGRPPCPARRLARRVAALPLALAAVALLAGAALFLSGYMLGTRTATTPGTPAADAALFAPFWDTWDSITRSYVGPVDQKTIVEGAIDGMIKALGDPYSAYMSPAALQSARDSLAGQFEGIGAVVTARSSAGAGGACAPLGPPAG